MPNQETLKTDIETRFKAWYLASKYCQVVSPENHWEQIALDGFLNGFKEGVEFGCRTLVEKMKVDKE